MPLTICKHVIDLYHLYFNHPGGIRLVNSIQNVCYWKGIVTQADMSVKTCNKCQYFNQRNNIYGQLLPKIFAALKLWYLVRIYLICTYSNSIIQQHPGGKIIKKDVSLACITMIDHATGWFEIVKIPCFDLDDVAIGNNYYIEILPNTTFCGCGYLNNHA